MTAVKLLSNFNILSYLFKTKLNIFMCQNVIERRYLHCGNRWLGFFTSSNRSNAISVQASWWECIWCTSFFTSILGLTAIQRNCIKSMQQYMLGIIIFCFGPMSNAIVHYFADVWTYMSAGGKNVWQGFPYGLLWYGFILLAFQVHLFSLYFAWKLICIWKANSRNAKNIFNKIDKQRQ